MVVDGFGSSFGLVWIIGSSLLVSSLVLYGQQPLSSLGNNPCPLWTTTLVLCGTATLVLYGIATIVLCGTATLILYGAHHPLWLSFCLIGWFDLLVRFWDESLWSLVKVARQPFGSCGLRGSP
jgi:hypothetical protein